MNEWVHSCEAPPRMSKGKVVIKQYFLLRKGVMQR